MGSQCYRLHFSYPCYRKAGDQLSALPSAPPKDSLVRILIISRRSKDEQNSQHQFLIAYWVGVGIQNPDVSLDSLACYSSDI